MRNRKESGITLIMGTVSLLFIIPMVGLSIDVGFLYAVKAKMQSAVDGSALAAARALNIGQSLASQTTAAQNNAVNWFYANFPSDYFGTTDTVMGTGNVTVFPAANNPQLFNVTVSATTQVNTYFMKWLGFGATTIGATGNASRRTVVAMLVLDRSGSMGPVCGDLINAAKLFVGQFAAQRDFIGLVSFSDGFVVQQAPTQDFQAQLGYTNSSGTGSGKIDTIKCNGNTGSAQAMSIAHNELIKTNLPGALNVVLFETDGLPNTLTLNWWDVANNVAGLASIAGGCQDTTGTTKKKGGFANAKNIPSWTPAHVMGTSAHAPVSYADIPANQLIGTLHSDDPPPNGTPFDAMYNPYQTTVNNKNGNSIALSGGVVNGCKFITNATTDISDLAWLPTSDIYGNQLNPASGAYKTGLTMNGTHIAANNWPTYHDAAMNALDNAAFRVRSNLGQPANVGLGPVTVFVIGLGGNGAVDFTLLQRVANDQNGDLYNDPPANHYYNPCVSQPGCVTYPGPQPPGKFVYSADKTKLVEAFLTISSQILRLSK